MPRSTLRITKRSRMLAVIALAGAAALVAGCTADGDGPASPSGPQLMPGAPPVPLDDQRLPSFDVFDGTEEASITALWATPGESIAIIVGGSGAGGECIPQPQEAGLDVDEPSVTVRFDPANPDTMCTMDFRLHGWELVLAEPVDPAAVLPVRLVNTSGAEETIEIELGPDDLLDGGPTADPQPSVLPGSGETAEPEPIPAAELPDLAGMLDPQDDPAAVVRWLEPGRTLAVLLGGSGSEHCVPQPIGAKVTGPGSVEVEFEYPTGELECRADFRAHGWSFPLAEAFSSTLPVEVTVTGVSADGAPFTATVERDDVLDAG